MSDTTPGYSTLGWVQLITVRRHAQGNLEEGHQPSFMKDIVFCHSELAVKCFIQVAQEHQGAGGGRALFYAEEEEVEERDVMKDVELFQSACSDIQRTILEIKALKESKDKNAVRNKCPV